MRVKSRLNKKKQESEKVESKIKVLSNKTLTFNSPTSVGLGSPYFKKTIEIMRHYIIKTQQNNFCQCSSGNLYSVLIVEKV